MEKNDKKVTFASLMEKYGHYVAIGLAAISIFVLFAPLLTIKTNGGDYFDVALPSFFCGSYQYDWTMIVTLCLGCVGIVLAFLKPISKHCMSISTFVLILYVAMLALAKSFFGNNSGVNKVYVQPGLYASIILAAFATLFALSDSYSNNEMSVRDIAEEGMLVAMAWVLNLITLFKAPTGGSVNLQMLPLFLLALRHGPTHGLIAGGIVYGLISCMTDGYGLQTYPFDYLIGFGSIVVIGLFKPLIFNGNTNYNPKSELFLLLAGVFATFIRLVGSTLSSMILYEVPFVDSLIYNSIYIPVSGGIALGIIMLLFGPLAKLNARFPIKHSYLL